MTYFSVDVKCENQEYPYIISFAFQREVDESTGAKFANKDEGVTLDKY